jgi:hypothetical protein
MGLMCFAQVLKLTRPRLIGSLASPESLAGSYTGKIKRSPLGQKDKSSFKADYAVEESRTVREAVHNTYS